MSNPERDVQMLVRSLKKGMVIVCPITGRTRTVTTDARACKQRGYYRAETTGEPVNTHGLNSVTIRLHEAAK